MTVTLFLLSETCSDAHTCLVSNDQHGEESLSPGDTLFILMLRGVAAPNRVGFVLERGRRDGHGDGEYSQDDGFTSVRVGIGPLDHGSTAVSERTRDAIHMLAGCGEQVVPPGLGLGQGNLLGATSCTRADGD